ncbi:hypothetical protein JZ751_009608 [Albula glossodonta]|uniref:Ig-like domain-containing protein n=1 Tax=Albula glossodonta TaxID=121402 RepID=A0A8T2P8W6_9TELE|nr:hypothetical protein JZ751_009608 [Albula glossodonta]
MLYLLALFVICVSGDDAVGTLLEGQSQCGDRSVLKCTAVLKRGVQYRTVRWYKISGDAKETGVLFKALKNDSTVRMFDNFERPAYLVSENSLDLLLPNVTAQDTGKYRCHLSAPVGERNVDGHVFLTVSGCPVEKEERDLMYEVIVCVSLVLALVICFLCWVSTAQSILHGIHPHIEIYVVTHMTMTHAVLFPHSVAELCFCRKSTNAVNVRLDKSFLFN